MNHPDKLMTLKLQRSALLWVTLPSMVNRNPYRHSNTQNLNWDRFRQYLNNKFVPSYAKMNYCYGKKYAELLNNPSELESFSKGKKKNILKALIALSKYLGLYGEFKDRLKDYDIKWSSTSSIDSFFRIFNNNSKDVLEWYMRAINTLDDDCKIYLKFLLLSGLRPTEAIHSFNLIRTRFDGYYNEGILEHFRYPKLFLRNTKNVFITIVSKSLLEEITHKNKMTYPTIRMRLRKYQMQVRLTELRDYYATFMVRNGLIREEVDLLQGRISKSIFVRHYWSPAIKELKQRVLEALKELEANILS